jgi:hypothetical protein
LAIIGAVLTVTILLLAVPVHLVYALRKDDVWRGRVTVYWMFGLIRVRLRPGRRKAARPSKRRKRRALLVSGTRGAVRRRRDVLAILRTRGLLRGLFFLLRDLLRALRPRRLRVEFVIGMEDPADTGRLAAVLAPLRVLFGRRTLGKASNVAIEVTPDFAGPRFQGYSSASVQFLPLRLMGLMIGFLFSPPVFRAMRGMMKPKGSATKGT